jgi:glutaconyl-CoA/methylmalonyl-CoA decarboxylase subunit gamma
MRNYSVTLDGTEHQVSVLKKQGTELSFVTGGKTYTVDVAPLRSAAAAMLTSAISAPTKPTAPSSSNPKEVRAPMPGVVVSIGKNVGDSVNAGDTLLVMEAMKMENNIAAAAAGTIKTIHVAVGNELDSGQLLVEFE